MNDKQRALVAPSPSALILEGDPEAQLDYAQRASKALMKRVEAKPKKVIINNKQYLEFGDWQMLGSFFGGTVATEWVKPIEREGQIAGYEARALVWARGQMISAAEASCLRAEKNWATRDEFAIKSMAQTRAGSKALRNAFGWVAELGGFAGTPAEEMDDQSQKPSLSSMAKPRGARIWATDFIKKLGQATSQPALVKLEQENERRLQVIYDTDRDLFNTIQAAFERRNEDFAASGQSVATPEGGGSADTQ